MAVLARIAAAGVLALAIAAPAIAQSPAPAKTARAHRAIATASPQAQAAFDRGLAFLYAFNMGAARLEFRDAERLDPHAAAAYFGEAMTDTFDINQPTSPEGERRGADAVARGLAVADAGSSDRALLLAAAKRFDAKRSIDKRYDAFFAAIQAYCETHPADGMADVIAADAGWNALPQLTDPATGALVPGAKKMAADLDAALILDPDDLGAHHLRIHVWEDAHDAAHALSDADYLASLTYDAGESHLPHMAGHIYTRLGMYRELIDANVAAYKNDDEYFASGNGPGQQYMKYYHLHDAEFVLYGLTTLGENERARAFAADAPVFAQMSVALRLHDDRKALALNGATVNVIRVVCEARLGNVAAAERDLRSLTAADAGADGLAIARGNVALAKHDPAAAAVAFAAAVKAIGTDLGDPKTWWQAPPGEALGAALLAAGSPAAAERAFAADLERYPNDPRLEFGLAEAQKAQGKDDSAARASYMHGVERRSRFRSPILAKIETRS